jgi:glutamate--cysteine ligase
MISGDARLRTAERCELAREVRLMLQESSLEGPDRIGVEVEYLGFSTRSGCRIRSDSCSEFLALFQRNQLADAGSSVSFEPGFQVEFSSRPTSSLPDLCRQCERFMHVIGQARSRLGVSFIERGFDVISSEDDLPWNLTPRYSHLKAFLSSRGPGYRDMMSRTAGIHVNLDFADSESASLKFVLWNLAAPVLIAMFANSPSANGQAPTFRSKRAATWLQVDSPRVTVPSFVADREFSAAAYTAYVANVPFIFQEMDELPPSKTSPKKRLRDHLRSIYTPCRLKPGIVEIRSFDTGGLPHIMSAAALCRGASATKQHLHEAIRAIPHASPSEIALAQEAASRDGLNGKYAGYPLRTIATDLLGIAADGLKISLADDVQYLNYVKSFVDRGLCPADVATAADCEKLVSDCEAGT